MNITVTLPLLFLLIMTAAGAVVVKDLIGAVFILGSYSFFLAVIWAWMGAPDVAFTEAVVGAGLSTIFFLLTLFSTTPRQSPSRSYRTSWLLMAGLFALGILMVDGAQDLPRLGDGRSPANSLISPMYIENSFSDTATPNMVTAVLMDYRGIDTLIETTVIFTAGVAVLLLLRRI